MKEIVKRGQYLEIFYESDNGEHLDPVRLRNYGLVKKN